MHRNLVGQTSLAIIYVVVFGPSWKKTCMIVYNTINPEYPSTGCQRGCKTCERRLTGALNGLEGNS